MRVRRFAVAVAGLATIAALAACQETPAETPGTGASASASAQTQASASDALAKASTKLRETTAKMTMSMTGTAEMKVTGSIDGPKKASAMVMQVGVMGQNLNMETIQLGDELWLKAAGVPGMPADWMHVDIAKLGAESTLKKQMQDPSYTENLLRSAAAVEWDGTNKVKGTIDMTKSPTMNAAAAAALGANAGAVPFEATLDDQGRLLTMTVKVGQAIPQAGVGDMTVAYSNYGEAVTIAKPTGKIVEAPAAILGAL
ncbi:hypothetical protein [Catellatospora sp. NPDC049609]|uniref:hypothetical protein n=1 Tax=Catellatospora sp. NPDC049609 TaxID=3155505 RepID=UPI0034177F32